MQGNLTTDRACWARIGAGLRVGIYCRLLLPFIRSGPAAAKPCTTWRVGCSCIAPVTAPRRYQRKHCVAEHFGMDGHIPLGGELVGNGPGAPPIPIRVVAPSGNSGAAWRRFASQHPLAGWRTSFCRLANRLAWREICSIPGLLELRTRRRVARQRG